MTPARPSCPDSVFGAEFIDTARSLTHKMGYRQLVVMRL